jgi:uncharacterized membrane protein
MPIVCLLLAFALGSPNPLSFGGSRSDRFDPGNPGIVGIVRHPLLWALALWAGSHIMPNGDLAHVLLFSTFTALALIGMQIIDRRMQRKLGHRQWQHLARSTSNIPFRAATAGLFKSRSMHNAALCILSALLIYLVFLIFHETVVGVSPYPL